MHPFVLPTLAVFGNTNRAQLHLLFVDADIAMYGFSKNDLRPGYLGVNGTMSHAHDSNNRKAVQRREVFTAWILLSTPMIGFVAYLLAYLGLNVESGITPLVAALILTVACLFFLSWVFISYTQADWVKTTRFVAVGLIFEGFVLGMTRAPGREASVYFGVGSVVIGLMLILSAKRH